MISDQRIYLSLFLMFLVIYSVRMLPMVLLRRPITNRWLRSFLHYVPYVTLAVMTFPAIVQDAGSMAAGIAALIAGLLTAWFSGDLFIVAISCCAASFICSLIL